MTTSLYKIKAAPRPKPHQPQPEEPDAWRIYEREKSVIAATVQSIDEYEIRIKQLCKRLGL